MFALQIKETLLPPSLYTLIKENLREYKAKAYMHSSSLVNSFVNNALYKWKAMPLNEQSMSLVTSLKNNAWYKQESMPSDVHKENYA